MLPLAWFRTKVLQSHCSLASIYTGHIRLLHTFSLVQMHEKNSRGNYCCRLIWANHLHITHHSSPPRARGSSYPLNLYLATLNLATDCCFRWSFSISFLSVSKQASLGIHLASVQKIKTNINERSIDPIITNGYTIFIEHSHLQFRSQICLQNFQFSAFHAEYMFKILLTRLIIQPQSLFRFLLSFATFSTMCRPFCHMLLIFASHS